MDYELAEVAILAAAMRDDTGRASAHALERLTNEDFTSPARQRMFETLSKLAPDANEVDLMMELPDISEEVTFVAEHYGGGKIDRYLDHVIENRNVRSLERALLVAQDGMTEGLPAEQIASSFNSSLAHAFSSRHGQVRMKEAAQEAHASFLSANAGDESAIPTGFSKLDKHLEGGLRPGRLYVIGARPGMGKSALAIHVTLQAAKRGIRTSYCSLEMTAAECASRLLAAASGIARPKEKNSLTKQEKDKLAHVAKQMTAWPITFKDDAQASLESVSAFFARQRAEGDLGLAVVDYLQLLNSSGFDNRAQEIAHVSRSLKQLALEFEVPVLALSQLNRGSAKENRKPSLSDLRESGAIEQDADCVLLLDREKEIDRETDAMWMNLAKNRNSQTGVTFSTFEKPLSRFSSYVEPRLNDEPSPF
tara:strand:+ start:743 stop:2008 length:1266 start_codon:yes stop_codon:yes gene_type:complete